MLRLTPATNRGGVGRNEESKGKKHRGENDGEGERRAERGEEEMTWEEKWSETESGRETE